MSADTAPTRTILVVDDQASNLHLQAGILRKAGFEVRTCDNGDAGMEVLEQQKFDVVLLDIVLGGRSGLDMLELVRKGHGINKDTPIIMYTSDGRSVVKQQAAVLGASMFLDRPISPVKLLEAVGLMLGDDAGEPGQD